MKGIYGLLVALALGVAGMLVNWFYLDQRARHADTVHYVGVKTGVVVNQGDLFRESDLEKILVPKSHEGSLRDFAVLWDNLPTVFAVPATRRFRGPELVLQSDLVSPPEKGRELDIDERLMPVPVDSRTFVAGLYKSRDLVYFMVPRSGLAAEPGAAPEAQTESIGPFEIWSVGDRMASVSVARSANQPISQQNVLQIVVKVDDKGNYEPKAQKLANLLVGVGVRNMIVIRAPTEKPKTNP
ncbi:MAG: hypothetical protein HYS13_03925 [Planctomycetia bacterium]|nr:hypothetical protein [Planctomycetia bacterium]